MTSVEDKIQVEDKQPDIELQHVEDPKGWAEIKVEAERAESFQRGLGLLSSLKVYRAVSRPTRKWSKAHESRPSFGPSSHPSASSWRVTILFSWDLSSVSQLSLER